VFGLVQGQCAASLVLQKGIGPAIPLQFDGLATVNEVGIEKHAAVDLVITDCRVVIGRPATRRAVPDGISCRFGLSSAQEQSPVHSSILPGVLCQTYEQSVTKQRSSRIKMTEENALDVSTGVEEEASAKPARAALLSTARLKKLNERLGLFLNLGAKLVAIVGVTMLVALILGQIFRSENFSIARLDVPGELESRGYTGELIARHIADDMRSLVAEVPDKLVSMFVVDGMGEEDKKKLENSIVEEYEERKNEVNISLSFAMFDLPIDQFLVHIREWLGIDNTTVESAITIEDTTISMSVGLVKNGDTSDFEVFHEHYDNQKPNSMYRALDRLIGRTAEFILKTNHPIVMILQDYHYVPGREYSERDELWNDEIFTADERIKILVARSENPPDGSRAIEKWAHAILGVIRDDQKDREKAIDHYQEAIEADSRFVTTVGPKLVRLQLYDQSWEGCEGAIRILDDILALDAENKRALQSKLAALKTQRQLIADQPDQELAMETVVASYKKLLREISLSTKEKLSVQRGLMETLAEFDGKEEFYSSLASALDDGLKLSEDDLAFAPWERYVKEPRFRELLNISPQQQGND
jgi:tetratricopeptide (TPR) repeat protein